MDNDLYNGDYFDFKKLAVPERFIKTNTNNCKYAFETCLEVAKGNKCVGLITEPGYGARSGIEDFIKVTREYKEYYGLCSRSNNLKKILSDFLRGELPAFADINGSNEDSLISAISYHFNNINRKRKRIMIFYNLENLTGLRPFGVLYKLAGEMKDVSGVLVSINAVRFAQLQKLAAKHSDINNFLTVFEWRELPPPSPDELGQHCFNRGALGKRVVNKLLAKASDFRILNMEINKIRELLVKKGYVKDANS